MNPAYADSLWAGWQSARGPADAATLTPRFRQALTGVCERARAELGFEVTPAAVARLISSHVEPGAGVETLEALRGDELYLVAGCLEGEREALEAFDRRILKPVIAVIGERLLRGLGRDELAQQTRERLLVATGGKARLAGWGGKSPLGAWVRAVSTRLALDARDAAARTALEDEQTDELIARLPAEGNPELIALKSSHRLQLTTALRQAVKRLPRRERTVLRLHVFQGLSTDQLGRVFHANGSTVRRWIQGARETVLAGVREALREQFALSVSQVDSVVRGVDGQFTLSLSALNSVND